MQRNRKDEGGSGGGDSAMCLRADLPTEMMRTLRAYKLFAGGPINDVEWN